MIHVTIITTQVHDGEVVERVGAQFAVRGQDVELLDGDGRLVQIGLPVHSDRYGRLIDFDTDGEEWARNLPRAYHNGSIFAESKEVVEARPERVQRPKQQVPALALQSTASRRR